MRKAAAGIALVLAVGVGVGGCSISVAGTPSADPAAVAAPRTTASMTPTTTLTGPPTVAPTGALAPGPPADIFADSRGRFRMVPPPSWTVDTSGTRGAAVVFLDPEPTPTASGPFTANINVIVVPASADLPATVVGARQELLGLNRYVSATDEPFTLRDGTPAHMLGGTFTDPGSGLDLRSLQLFTVVGASTIVVTGTALATTWDVHRVPFDTALRTLTVVA